MVLTCPGISRCLCPWNVRFSSNGDCPLESEATGRETGISESGPNGLVGGIRLFPSGSSAIRTLGWKAFAGLRYLSVNA